MKPVASPNATFQSWLEDLCRHLGNGISDWSTLILPLFPCPLQEKTIFKAKRYRIWGLQAREGGLWPWAQPESGWACPLFLDKWICLGYWLCYSLSVLQPVCSWKSYKFRYTDSISTHICHPETVQDTQTAAISKEQCSEGSSAEASTLKQMSWVWIL